jgi:hypothetical protein
MVYDFLTTPTKEQLESRTKLTKLVGIEPLGKIAPLVKILEDEGFSLVISEPPQELHSILTPSGNVLNPLNHKNVLNNRSMKENPEINNACLYFGAYLGSSSKSPQP